MNSLGKLLLILIMPLVTLFGIVATPVMWISLVHAIDPIEWPALMNFAWLKYYALWAICSMVFCFFMAKSIAIWATRADSIYEGHAQSSVEHIEFLHRAQSLAQKMGLTSPIEYAVYPLAECNIYSLGFSRISPLVVVSEGFLRLEKDQQNALLLRELGAMKRGDTGLLELCQGMTFAFNLFFARALAFVLGTGLLSSEGKTSSTLPEKVVYVCATTFLSLWGSLVVLLLSRYRHYRADEAMAQAVGPQLADTALQQLARAEAGIIQNDLFSSSVKAVPSRPLWKGAWPAHPAIALRRQRLGLSH